MDLKQITDWLGSTGLLGVFVLALLTGRRGDWVFGREHKAMEAGLREQLAESIEREQRTYEELQAWQRQAFEAVQASRQATAVAERATSLATAPGAFLPPSADERR